MDGNGEEIGGVVGALAEVVFADFARGGEMRRGDLIGPVDAVGARAGLLNAGVDGEGRAGARWRMLRNSQPAVTSAAGITKQSHAIEMQVLRRAEAEGRGRVESGRTFFRVIVEGILGRCSQRAMTPLLSSMDLLQV